MSAKNTKTVRPDKKNAGGPKTKYNPELLERIKAWVRNGATNKDICAKIGINQNTLYIWIRKHGELCEALKRTKEIVDDEVENALYKRAIGFEYDEIHETDGPLGFTRKVVKKYVPPSEVACFFWLKNRRPDKWRAKNEIDFSDNGNMQELINAVKGIFNS